MKQLKISFIGAIALILGVASSAFTPKASPANSPATITWFKFMGDPSNLSQIQDYTQYTYVDGLACSGSNLICAVQTNGTASAGQHPAAPFSNDLKNRLSNEFNHTATYGDISQKP